MDIREAIAAYRPVNAQEAADQQELLRQFSCGENIFSRANTSAHMTASAWITNPAHTRVLMAYHNIYRSWSWLGGHADGERDLLAVAAREVLEESGLTHFAPVSGDIFSLEILTVDGHEKHGAYVSSHLHLNVTYLFEAEEAEKLTAKPDENQAVAWFGLDEAVAASTEPWFRARIYTKLNQKLRALASPAAGFPV